MSLHKFAEQVASQGRGDDSLLVHMTPDEVQRLQSFAQANGRTMTINPTTGLPEAGMLSDLFKAVAPIALGAFLGPGAFGIAGLGLSAGTAGLITGGLTTLATGSLSRGLMAGMGAYSGAGLAEGFMGAGAGAAQQSAMGALTQDQITAKMAESGLTQQGVLNQAAADATKSAMANTGQAVSSGFNAVTASPESAMNFAKQNWKPIAAAALPVLSAIGTTTPGPTASPMAPGKIREKRWDGRQFVDVASTDAGVYNTSGRSFSDLYRGYNDGGGIVALAGGGDVVRMAKGVPPAMLTDEQLYQKSGLSGQAGWEAASKARDAQNVALNNYNLTDNATVGTNINKWITDNPFATTADINKAITTSGLTQDLVNPYLTANTNISDAARYALSHASEMPGGGGLAGLNANILKEFATNPGMNQASIDRLQDIYKVSDADIQRPLSHGFQVANTDTAKAQNYLNTNPDVMAWVNSAEGKAYVKAHPEFDASDIAYTHFKRYGEGEGRKWEAPTAVTKDTVTGGTGKDVIATKSGYHIDDDGVLVPNISATQNTTTTVATPTDLYTAPATSLPVGVSGNTGPSQIGGGATINPNGTVTTSPRIPDIPVGGFTGSKNLRDTYTKGGGSLGFAPKAPETMDEFNTMFNKQTGDSLAAYNYLTGKAGAAYPIKSGVGQIARPYDEAVLGYPARGNLPYIYNKVTGKMDVNPDYVAPGRDAAGNVTYSMSTNDIKKALTDAPLSGQALYDWAKSNNLSAQQISDATGRSLSSVYSDFRAGSKAAANKTADAAKGGDTIQVTDSSGYNTETVTATKQADGTYLGGNGKKYDASGKEIAAGGGMMGYALGGLGSLGSYSDGGRLLRGPGDGVSDSIPATIGNKQQPARLADGEFVVPARIVSELGNGSTDAGAKKLYAMLDRVQRARGKTTGKNKVAANSRAEKYLPA